MTDPYKSKKGVNRIQGDVYYDHMIILIPLYKRRSVVTIICTLLFKRNGIFFAVAKYGVYFLGTVLKFCVWHTEVFYIHNEKYLKCMIYRHAWVNIQIW